MQRIEIRPLAASDSPEVGTVTACGRHAASRSTSHGFNHGTHQRGQISAALASIGRPAPELDLVIMLQEGAKAP